MKALESNIVLLISKQAKLAIPVIILLLTVSILEKGKLSPLGIWQELFQSHNCCPAEVGSVKNTLTKINISNRSEQRDVGNGEYTGQSAR